MLRPDWRLSAVALSLASLRTRVLNILQKQASYSGFYTPEKCNQAINECMDYIASRMMHEMGNGWMQSLDYITTVAATESYALPAGTALVREVRYLVGATYVPLTPVEATDEAWIAPAGGSQMVPSRYELIGGNIVFNPAPSVVGTNYVQLKVTKFPTELTADGDTLVTQFSRALEGYLVYRAASLLVMGVGNPSPEWQRIESEWYGVMEQMITGRIKKPKFIKGFRF